MKTRIMFYLVLVALFGFAGNSFTMEEMEEPSEIDTPEEYNKIIGPQGTEGTTNTFYGNLAGNVTMTGNANSFFGFYAGYNNTTGNYNSFFGYYAGYNNTTAAANSFFGFHAGFTNKTGIGNVFLGYKAGYNETGSNRLYIDNSDTSTPLIWGDFNTNNVVIYGGFRSIASNMSSGQRWKKNIKPLESSLDKISRLHRA